MKVFDCLQPKQNSIYFSKYKYMMFIRRLQLPLDMPSVFIKNAEIGRPVQVKFLGVLLDEKLCFNQNNKFVISKVSKFV